MMATYHIKRAGKLYGPFTVDQVAKSIAIDIFTTEDMITSDQITWCRIEEFQKMRSVVKQVPLERAAVHENANVVSASESAPFCNTLLQKKSRRDYIAWALFLGNIGAHDFYAGCIWQGVVKVILTLAGASIISAIWTVINICNTRSDNSGVPFSEGRVRTIVYRLFGLFAGFIGYHHFYAGFAKKGWLRILFSFILAVVCYMFVSSEEPLFALIAMAVYGIFIIYETFTCRVDANGNAFI